MAEWRDRLARAESAEEVNALRVSTHTGRPLGTPEFVAALEMLTLRPLAPRKGGTPKEGGDRFGPAQFHLGCVIRPKKPGNVPSVPAFPLVPAFPCPRISPHF